jgi:transcription antitermination factor NusG
MRTLTAYTTPPQKERKAVQEAREAGLRAYVPTEKKTYRGLKRTVTRRVPIAPGYVFAEGKPYEAKHIRTKVGTVERNALARLYPRRDRGHRFPVLPFEAGDRVTIQRGPFAQFIGTIIGHAGKRGWMVEVRMFGREMEVAVATDYMRKHDPG